jgi:crotonobetainyl-CoA:carnitine CoA-transferase CaiB-like acyl-CoA transferase
LTGEAQGPLAGIRVIELGTMVAGPVAATLLGDFGADVIKIEQPKGGDPIRQSGAIVEGESLYWNVEGRNKRSVTIDMRVKEGQALLRDLVKHADVLIENFRPGTMARWGCDYATLKAINPRLVMLSISGYGQDGPNSALPSYDRVALAFAGFLNITGYPDRPPVRPGTAIADYQTALFGAFAVMIALYHRDAKGGTGQQIDAALYETIFRFTDTMITAYDKLGVTRHRTGNSHYAASPGDHYAMQDGRFLALTVAANNVFQRLCVAMGQPELADDDRFATHPARVKNYEEINGIVANYIRSTPPAEVLASFAEQGVPHSLILSVEEILVDPHYAARGTIATIDHPRIGPIKMPAVLPRLMGTPPPPLRAAPLLGENTDEILTGLLGMQQTSVDELRAQGVI